MLFALITFFAAFSIEVLGTYVSVIGLSTLFGANPIIIALAVALDVGKLVVVSLLYKYWDKLGVIMKSYALVAAAITMIITSAGAAGYLSGEFQKAMVGTQEVSLKVDVLKGQIAKYEERKRQIDDQIAAIPEKYSANQRIRLMNQFKAEQKDLQDKIAAIDKDLPALQIQQISVEAKAGPILYISKAFDIPVEAAVKWVILMIIFVFDPLAVFLIIAGNFLWDQRKQKSKDEELNKELAKFEPEKHGGEFPPLADREFEERSDKVRAAVETYDDFTLAEPSKADTHYTYVPPTSREDMIAIGVPDANLIALGFEPREAAPNAAIEVAPAEPEVAPTTQEVAPTAPEATPANVPAAVQQAADQPHPSLNTVVNSNGVRVPTDEERRHAYETQEARRAGMSLEDWRAMQLRKLDRIQEGVDALANSLRPREQITLSTLGLVKADPNTVVDAADTTGLGGLDPRVRPDIFPPR